MANKITEINNVIKKPLYNAPIIDDLGVDIETNWDPIIDAKILEPAISKGYMVRSVTVP